MLMGIDNRYMYTYIYKVKNVLRNLILIGMFSSLSLIGVSAVDGALSVNSISVIKGSAIANSSYPDGWRWIFDVTVPEAEPMVRLRFSDWFNGTSTISAGGNVRYYSQYSTNASTSQPYIYINSANTYGGIMALSTAQLVLIGTKTPLFI